MRHLSRRSEEVCTMPVRLEGSVAARNRSTSTGALTRPKQSARKKGRQPASPLPRTGSSNPLPSRRESANFRFLFPVPTMSALVLSLLIASAKTAFDTRSNQLVQASADIILPDRGASAPLRCNRAAKPVPTSPTGTAEVYCAGSAGLGGQRTTPRPLANPAAGRRRPNRIWKSCREIVARQSGSCDCFAPRLHGSAAG